MFYLGIDVAKAKLDCVLLLNVAANKGWASVIQLLADYDVAAERKAGAPGV